jgi:hypothetical protein
MLYYVYYDAYGHARKAIDKNELAECFQNDVDVFFKHMCASGNNQEFERATGHVGTLRFADEDQLQEFLDSLGDEIYDFYDGAHNSRPYNF